MEQVRRMLEQRETELAQLTSTPLVHRVDQLQQQLQLFIKEKDEALKKVSEVELRVESAKKKEREKEKEMKKSSTLPCRSWHSSTVSSPLREPSLIMPINDWRSRSRG
jgi:hypothetical protein